MEDSAFAPYLHLLKPDHSIHSPYLHTPAGWVSLAQVWQEEVLVHSVGEAMETEQRWPEPEELDDCQPDPLELSCRTWCKVLQVAHSSVEDT